VGTLEVPAGIQKVVNDDADAFGELFEYHARRIYNYCFRRTGDWALAEDLTSVVFLECWRRRAAAPAGDELVPWLFGIATNVCRRQWRSLARYHAALKRLPTVEATPGFADETVERIEDERRMRAVLEAVSQLPQREQDVLALCVWAELTYSEAAAALQIPIGTVRSRLARARARLEGCLDRVGEEEVANDAC
jgi:RNA polymerase sigma factor (sigma-70 family)